MQTQLVILDVETTGFKPEEGHEVIEIGALKVVHDQVLEEFNMLLKCSRPVAPESMNVHHITDAMLEADGHDPKEAYLAFKAFAGDHVLVGHNVQFDLHFLNFFFAQYEMDTLKNMTMDTLEIARRLLILPSYSLEKVAAYLKVPQPEAHRALADVRTTHAVLLKLFERAKV